MVVGVCRLLLSLPGVDSLKGKRSIVRRVLDRTRARFNVAAAEVGRLDAHRVADLALVVVSNDRRHANSMIDQIADFIGGASEAIVTQRSFELISLSSLGEVSPDMRQTAVGGVAYDHGESGDATIANFTLPSDAIDEGEDDSDTGGALDESADDTEAWPREEKK